ncbi:MAG: hypothetical protein HYX67_05175 [Candidatus Melainabacteria bacterium]|nr:hypothetical protein [Candidatus Melainabacteria bacterium]
MSSSWLSCIPASTRISALNYMNFSVAQPESMFVKSLREFCTDNIEKEVCLEKLRISCEDHLKGFQGDVLVEGLSLLKKFEDLATTSETAKFDELRIDFKSNLTKTVEEKWANALAKEFFPIPDLKEAAKQIAAAESFSKHFLEGAAHLAKLKGVTLDDPFVAKLIEIAQKAFEGESRCVIDQKLNGWLARANNAIYGIPQDDINLAFQDSRGHFPWIDRGRDLLKDISKPVRSIGSKIKSSCGGA